MSDTKKPEDAKKIADDAKPKAAAPAPDDDADEAPETRHDETIPGGAYRRGTTIRGGKHYGGHIGDANGRVLAVFGPKEINTGNPKDGKPPTDDDGDE